MKKIAILGLGSRGAIYGSELFHHNVEITAVCDLDSEKTKKFCNAWNVKQSYNNSEAFFSTGKLADALVITTQDRDHYQHAMKALQVGYNLLLEKPISPILNECLELEETSKNNGLFIFICHVLRYSKFYRSIKNVIDSGILGEIINIRHQENVGFYHFAHSFVRGNWNNEKRSSPLILAKCCHDMDLLYWLCNSKAKSISSLGSLKYFNKNNAPAGAAARCCDCQYNNTCVYDSKYLYVGRQKNNVTEIGAKGFHAAFTASNEPEIILKELMTNNYGRCVFSSDNDVCDHQTAHILMQNDIKIIFEVSAFTKHCHRIMNIQGTKGELNADDRYHEFTVDIFGDETKIISTKNDDSGHCGGDSGLIKDFIAYLNGNVSEVENLTLISESIESHRMAEAAELSRKNSGLKIDMKEI